MASYSLVHLLGCLLGGSWTDGQMNKQVQQNLSLVKNLYNSRVMPDYSETTKKYVRLPGKKTRTTSTKSDQQVVPKQGYPKLLKLVHNCLYRADFGGPLYLPFVFSPSVDWAEAHHSHFWREGPFVRAQALGDGQHDANDAHYFFTFYGFLWAVV